MPRLEQMFDPEVLAQLRETFDRADAGPHRARTRRSEESARIFCLPEHALALLSA